MCHVLVWYQNKCDIACLIRVHHVVFCVEHKKWQWRKKNCDQIHFNILVIKIFIIFHVILSVCPLLFTWLFFVLPFIQNTMFVWYIILIILNSYAKLTSDLCVGVLILILASNLWLAISFIVSIEWKINLSSVALSLFTTSLPCPCALITLSIIILKSFNNMYNNYNYVVHM